ncbi:MAG: SAM-dependent methyltransferase [Ottowia sp.]|nr:SAM-dependent methyltransferase [Ottowia sp.]
MTTLYLVPTTLGPATPTGVAAILSTPAQHTIAQLTYFVAENAKTTRAFLNALNHNTPLTQPLQHITINELNVRTPEAQLPALLLPLEQGFDVGLISEAGVPAVADPGANLVRLAHTHGYKVVPLVGPSSILLALMASGMNGQRFAFHGYLPQDANARALAIRQLESESKQLQQTQILIETPYRNVAMLQALLQCCHPNTWICAATDLTLESESVISQPVTRWQTTDPHYIERLHKRPTVFLLLA